MNSNNSLKTNILKAVVTGAGALLVSSAVTATAALGLYLKTRKPGQSLKDWSDKTPYYWVHIGRKHNRPHVRFLSNATKRRLTSFQQSRKSQLSPEHGELSQRQREMQEDIHILAIVRQMTKLNGNEIFARTQNDGSRSARIYEFGFASDDAKWSGQPVIQVNCYLEKGDATPVVIYKFRADLQNVNDIVGEIMTRSLFHSPFRYMEQAKSKVVYNPLPSPIDFLYRMNLDFNL